MCVVLFSTRDSAESWQLGRELAVRQSAAGWQSATGWDGICEKPYKTLRETTCCETLNKNLPRTNPVCSERIAPTSGRVVGGFCDHDCIRRDILADDVCSEGACGRQQHQ